MLARWIMRLLAPFIASIILSVISADDLYDSVDTNPSFIVSTASLLATSPPACPPNPSATIKSDRSGYIP